MIRKVLRSPVMWCLTVLLAVVMAAPAAQASSARPVATAGRHSGITRTHRRTPVRSAVRRCRTIRVPVTIPQTKPGQITGDLCVPATGHSTTALLLVAGGGENADYWNMPALPSYSLVDTATAAGYTTFAIDRLGTGRSTLPASSTLVTYAAQVATVHQVAEALRDDSSVFGRTWRTVVGVGHSLGSGTLAGVAAQYPRDLNAMILTGYGATVSSETLQLDTLYQLPARTVDPAKWGNLDPGYVTVVPSGVLQAGSLYPPATTPLALAVAQRTQGTLSTTELSTRPQGAAATAQAAEIKTPLLVADGQYDRHYCEDNAIGAPVTLAPACTSQHAFYSYERQLLSNACLATSLVPDSGHAIELQTAAPEANRTFVAWLEATLPSGSARCAVSGIDR
jgi:pimeloyl-ACP methyl ester carboxylesterase